MSYLNGLSGTTRLGALSRESRELIKKNSSTIKRILKRSTHLNGLGFVPEGTNLLSFNQMVKQYNTGISDDEIRAWVWYRRSIGIPMKGWEKYYIDGSTAESILLITTQSTIIKDNHFRDLKTIPEGVTLGKYVNKGHEYDGITYRFYRDDEGIKMVNSKHVRDEKNIKTDRKKLDALVNVGALFYNNGDLLPYPLFAYGNMYDRVQELKQDKAHIIKTYGSEIFSKHEQVIKDSTPRFLTITNPDHRERPKILAISKFAANHEQGVDISVTELREDTGIIFEDKTTLQTAFAEWLRKLNGTEFLESNAAYIINYYLDGRLLPRDKSKEAKAEIRRSSRNEGERLFDKFLHEALKFEDQQKIDLIWNRLYNGFAPVAHHKIPVGFSCSSKFQGFDFELRPAQREGVAYMELVGSGCIAYDVGVGKTITAIAELANSVSSGKCKRPLVIVPNATYNNWIRETIGETDKVGNTIEGLLSGTGIQLNEWYNLGTDMLKRVNLNKKVPEKSVTLVTYEGFKKIGFNWDIADELFVELSNILSQSDYTSERDKEIEYEKFSELVGIGMKDTIADIDVLGFDYIVIDEAHNCKNIFSGVKKDKWTGRRRFGISGSTSDMGIKAFFLTNYLQRKFGRNVMLLTATPFNNSPLEIYSMLSLIAYHSLGQMGIYNIKDFFERFVLETSEDVVTYNDQIKQKDVVKSFNNRMVLQRLIYNHFNYKTGEEANVKRPRKINLPKINESRDGKMVRLPAKEQVLTYLKMTPRQRANQTAIIEEMDLALISKKSMKNGDLLRALTKSLNNALHPCLCDNEYPEDYKDFVEESPKIKYTVECIKTVREYHINRNEPVSGQVIYCNRGKDYFGFIKEYLEKEAGYKKDMKWKGLKIDEVEIIDSSVSVAKKENVKNAFLDGVCKVIIGTATIREGINLQRKGTVLYNLLPDWNPTDLRQVEGRIWRQKNEFGFVRIVLPLVQDSMDVFIFQKLDEKTSRINDIWYKGDRGNVLDLESLDPEDVKFALLTDVDAIASSEIEKEVKAQERKIAILEDHIKTLKEYKQWVYSYETFRKKLVDEMTYYYKKLSDFDYIRNKPTDEQLKRYEKEQRETIKKQIAFYDESTRFFETVPTDKELIAMARKFNHMFSSFSGYSINDMVQAVSVLRKAEKTMANNGYTKESEVGQVIQAIEKELEQENSQMEHIKGDEHKWEVIREVKEKKAAMAIEGKPIGERVKEFARLNYLLSYMFADIPADGSIPAKEKPANRNDDDLALRIRITKAKLKLLKLKF